MADHNPTAFAGEKEGVDTALPSSSTSVSKGRSDIEDSVSETEKPPVDVQEEEKGAKGLAFIVVALMLCVFLVSRVIGSIVIMLTQVGLSRSNNRGHSYP